MRRQPFPVNRAAGSRNSLTCFTRAQNRNYALADGFDHMVRRTDNWKLFLHYQAQTERNWRRALEEFERLKALRHELPNEANYDPQPEAKETTSIPPEPTRFPPEPSGAGLPPAEPKVPS